MRKNFLTDFGLVTEPKRGLRIYVTFGAMRYLFAKHNVSNANGISSQTAIFAKEISLSIRKSRR